MTKVLKIGTRESQLAAWQAELVKSELAKHGISGELVYIRSEGDVDLVTPLYEIGIQGIFTKTLDAALLGHQIDIAVHSMKDVPTLLARGIRQAAVLTRASSRDLLVYKEDISFLHTPGSTAVIATSSVRRKAQWLHRYPAHRLENLRGNVNTRLRKVAEQNWNGAIFAAAGLERIGLRPEKSLELEWMLPAPAQGAIMVVCREGDRFAQESCSLLNDPSTSLCTRIERDFLQALMGGCSTPISALAEIKDGIVRLRGNIFSTDGKEKVETEKMASLETAINLGREAGREVWEAGGQQITEQIQHGHN